MSGAMEDGWSSLLSLCRTIRSHKEKKNRSIKIRHKTAQERMQFYCTYFKRFLWFDFENKKNAFSILETEITFARFVDLYLLSCWWFGEIFAHSTFFFAVMFFIPCLSDKIAVQ